MNDYLIINNVTKTYNNNFIALDNLNLTSKDEFIDRSLNWIYI